MWLWIIGLAVVASVILIDAALDPNNRTLPVHAEKSPVSVEIIEENGCKTLRIRGHASTGAETGKSRWIFWILIALLLAFLTVTIFKLRTP